MFNGLFGKRHNRENEVAPHIIPPVVPESALRTRSWLDDIPPRVQELSVVKDAYEGGINLLNKVKQGNRLEEPHLKQLFHAFDVEKFSSPDPAYRSHVGGLKDHLTEVLAVNDFKRVLDADPNHRDKPTFKYLGLEVPKTLGPDLFKQSMKTFEATDRHWGTKEIAGYLEEMKNSPLSRLGNDPKDPLKDLLLDARSSKPVEKLAYGGQQDAYKMLTPYDYTDKGAIQLDPDTKSFNKAWNYLYGAEGGYVNDKDDRGGATNYGVTQSTFNDYREKRNLPSKDVKDITPDEARTLYHDAFWKPLDKYDVSPAMKHVLFDVSVNSGEGTAHQLYRQAGDDLDTFFKLREAQYREYAKQPGQGKFLQGWLNRLEELKRHARRIDSEL